MRLGGGSPVLARLALAVVVAAVAGATLGVIVRTQPSDSVDRSPRLKPVAVGALRLRLPADWTPAPKLFSVPGLGGPRSITMQTSDGFVVIAQVRPADRSLLPAELRAAISGPVRRASTLPPDHGGAAILQYADLSVLSVAAPLTVYAVPTTREVAVMACTNASSGCASILSAVGVRDGRVLDLGPDAALRSRLGAVIGQLNRVRQGRRQRLATTTSASARADAARDIAAAYRAADRSLDPLVTGSAASTRTQTTLRRLARSYEALGAAAARSDRAGFARTGSDIGRRERALNRLLGAWNVPTA
jgi:hypothetical protein